MHPKKVKDSVIGLYFSEIVVDQTTTNHGDYCKSLKITSNFWPELYVPDANDIQFHTVISCHIKYSAQMI